MEYRSKLPPREQVFIYSLQYHGFRLTRRRKNFKWKRGYVIPATRLEDSGGIDLWVKVPRDSRLFPVQITQRGSRLFRHYHRCSDTELAGFNARSEIRLRSKRIRCLSFGIAFVLVRDYAGDRTNQTIAWGDIKALRHGIELLKRRMDSEPLNID